MSEIKGVGMLRKYAENSRRNGTIQVLQPCNLDELADEIEREISVRFMEFPVDADGVPIRPGDAMILESGEKGTVNAVRSDAFYINYGRYGYEPSKARHIKRAIEDVLLEVIERSSNPRSEWDGIVAEYADEIRGLL